MRLEGKVKLGFYPVLRQNPWVTFARIRMPQSCLT
jgi:hypothetical protein